MKNSAVILGAFALAAAAGLSFHAAAVVAEERGDVDILARGWQIGVRQRVVAITGGAADAEDWVAEQSVDVSAWDSPPERAAVFEIDAAGKVLGQKVSQFDMEESRAVLTWIVDGKLAAGEKRFFRIEFGKEGLASAAKIGVVKEEDALIVNGTGFRVWHNLKRAGLMTRAQVGEAEVELKPADFVCDSELNYYSPDNDKGAQIKVVAGGPLRTTIEARAWYYRVPVDPIKQAIEGGASYLGEKGASPATNARVRYRYTTILGMPVTRIDAFMEQDSAKTWREVEVGQFTFDRHFHNWALNIPARLGGKTTGVLDKKGYWYNGDRWAAVYDPDFLIGIYGRTGILDVKDPKSSCLFRSSPTSWRGLQHQRTVHMFFGGGPQDLEKFKALAPVLWDPPKTEIVVPQEIQNQIREARSHVKALKQQFASAAVEDYIAGSTVVGEAEQLLAAAEELAARGNFRGVVAKLGLVEEAVGGEVSHKLKRDGEYLSGRVGSSIIVANKHVSFGFADAEWGAGLTSVSDLTARREFLRAPAREARLWEITLKDNEGIRYLTDNRRGVPTVNVNVDQEKGEATILISWQNVPVEKRAAALSVDVRGMLKKDEHFLRWKIEARTLVPDLGLVKVAFPDVTGIKPISEGAQSDWIVNPSSFGHRQGSPLQTGENVGMSVPSGMQFVALTDGQRGLYCAEEDPTYAEKTFLFGTGGNRSALDLRVEHPVLNWGAKELQRTYSLPGPVVMGPYSGGWYDACRFYRRWALTAPWCRGGPLAVREDVPKWIKDLPCVRPENLGTESIFEYQEKLAGLPSGAHIYGWMARPGFHGGEAPYPEYRPVYGYEWFRSQVKRAQEAGVRIIPYTNGILWYTELESFGKVGIHGTVKGKNGRPRKANYGGKPFALMCPGSKVWRDTVTDFCLQLVEDGVDGIYLDQLSTTGPSSIWGQCWDESHGHPILGGNWWVEAVRGYMKQVRTTCRQKNNEVIFTSEGICEGLIDSFDIFLQPSWSLDSLPIFPAVYGGYAMSFGCKVYGEEQKEAPPAFLLTRWFIWGQKPGWGVGFMPEDSPADLKEKGLYRAFLLCYDQFARPFLTYGQMMRPPRLEGAIPKLLSRTGKTLDIPSVETTAWRTLDGRRLAVFIANYSGEARTVTWQTDLAEELGWQASEEIDVRRWDYEALETVPLGKIRGGLLRRSDKLGPYELLVLELVRGE